MFNSEAEAACRTGASPFTCAPPSVLHCAVAFTDPEASLELSCLTEHIVKPMLYFGMFHLCLHEELLASDAAAAQRTEAAAVVGARSCLHVARAVDGWQGDLAGTGKEFACKYAGDALLYYLEALDLSPAFSCAAARSQGSPRIPGNRALAAVMEVLQLAAEALQAVVDVPSLGHIEAAKYGEGGASISAAICSAVSHIAGSSELQTLPAGRCCWSAASRTSSCCRCSGPCWACCAPRCGSMQHRHMAHKIAWNGAAACASASRPQQRCCQRLTRSALYSLNEHRYPLPPCALFAAQGGGLAVGPRQVKCDRPLSCGQAPGSQDGGQCYDVCACRTGDTNTAHAA